MIETQVIFLETKRFLRSLRCTDIALSDFTEPTSDRLQKLLTTFLNFDAYLREEAGPKSEPLAAMAGQIAQDVHELAFRKENLLSIRNTMRAKKEREQDETDKLQLDTKAFEQELIDLRRECEARMQELDFAKAERLAVKDRLQSLQMEVLNAIDIRKGLQEKEDWDIGTLQEHASQLQEDIARFTLEMDNHREISPHTDDQIAQLKVLDTNLARAIKIINGWSSRRHDMKRQRKTCDAVQRVIETVTSENQDLATKSAALKRFAAAEELKIERLNEDQAKKRESMRRFWEFQEKEDEKLKREEATALEDRLEFEKKRDDLARKIAQVELSDKSFEESIATLLRQVIFKIKERIV
ncbi:hypothetical protein BD560DRAFT_241961 [Blakeslea trispora]|nr:hypothetical protein BD560DRAFT_241961 [Blakeslea trispora]